MKDELKTKIDEFRVRCAETPIPEAGGIAFTTVYMHGLPVNVTARATNAYDAIAQLSYALDLAHDALGIEQEKNLPAAPASKPDPAAKIAAEVGNQELAAELASVPVPTPPNGKEWNVTDAKTVKILPQPDERVTVEFYAEGHGYPDVKVNKWKADDVAALLKHVTSADVTKAAEYKLPCRVLWLEGKEFTTTQGKKSHYKDVAHVLPVT